MIVYIYNTELSPVDEMREKRSEMKIMQKSVSANALTLLIQAPGEFDFFSFK